MCDVVEIVAPNVDTKVDATRLEARATHSPSGLSGRLVGRPIPAPYKMRSLGVRRTNDFAATVR